MIDPHEAPDGYEAVAFTDCEHCAFFNVPCGTLKCGMADRKDETMVMFVKLDPRVTKLQRLIKDMLEYEGAEGFDESIKERVRKLCPPK
jgi:hypothetical protein